jgi:DMSO/TMAO reductase YedYZ heme-binding membrane subunit
MAGTRRSLLLTRDNFARETRGNKDEEVPVATTRSRPRGRETARPNDSGGAFAEHAGKIYTIAIAGIAAIVALLALTSTGHTIDLAVQHFMLFYAGVFALIGLCASVGAGLVATDRMVLNPGHRVFMQAIHRAISFGALAFLVIHIVTEILAQRVHIIDAFVPFMEPFKTFYIGIGTISSDLIILLVITSIFRKRFIANGKGAWRWRAIHYSAYVSFVFGVWHGLLGGRPGKPYVDWSYGFVVALVGLGLAVRILSNSLRPKESLSSAPVPDSASSGSAPMRAAAMFAQLGAARYGTATAIAASGPVANMLPAGGAWNAETGPVAALPAGALPTVVQAQATPVYEPGYDGPPRYAGAPRGGTGAMPQVGPGEASGAYQRPMTGPMPAAPGGPSGAYRRPMTGPMPTAPGGMSGARRGPAPGPVPHGPNGPMPPDPGAYQWPMTTPVPVPPDGPGSGYERPMTGGQPRQWDVDPGYGDPGQQPGAGYPGDPL